MQNPTNEEIKEYEEKVIYTIKIWEKCREDYGMKSLNHYSNEIQRFICAFCHDAHSDNMTYHDAAFCLVNRIQKGINN